MKNRTPTVYVMCPPEEVRHLAGTCRVGHHNQTDKEREAQVSRDLPTPHKWKICHSIKCKSKWAAIAVEALAHAKLEAHAFQVEDERGPWRWRCDVSAAKKALDDAHKVVSLFLS